jgi:alkanesulfonate monooxygenase SsuD/methylene tetrahydromethanopterin reductase-like flavin-dependent oxidoreductase (luciferase family)
LVGAVTPEMLDAFAMIGTAEECISKIERLIKTGVTHIVLAPSLISSPRKTLKQIHSRIVSVFNASKK